MHKATHIVVLLLAFSGSWANAEEAQKPTTTPADGIKPLQEGWEETDTRQVFLITQLASVESSLDAIDKALVRAGYKQASKKADADKFRAGNELMDRKGGGPVRWEEFYGKTADKFRYQQRPPQFEFIYRANDDRQQQAEKEVAALGSKVEALLDRRRQLESEQSAMWAKVAFRVVASRNLAGRSLYRFDLAGDASEAEHLEAVRAACEFIRTTNQVVSKIQELLDSNQTKAYNELHRLTKAAQSDLDARLVRQPHLALDIEDPKTPIGKLSVAAKRLEDVSNNVEEALKLAREGDKANDEQRKNTFRAVLQEMLINYAETLITTDQCASNLAREWKVVPNPAMPIFLRSKEQVSEPVASPSNPTVSNIDVEEKKPGSPDGSKAQQTRLRRFKIGDTITNSIGMKLAYIPGGEFLMGSPENEKGRPTNENGHANDEVQHKVRITMPFLMGTTEVTQGQWKSVMGNNPSMFKGDDNLPVDSVSWDDSNEFCRKLSAKDGREYRLPTEAEWEYACRAQTKDRFDNGDSERDMSDVGWFVINCSKKTHVVGLKRANPWGLFDMHGNVMEWCSDWFGPYPNGDPEDPTGPREGQHRVLRSGQWQSPSEHCRAASRSKNTPDIRHSGVGCRVVCPVGEAGLTDERRSDSSNAPAQPDNLFQRDIATNAGDAITNSQEPPKSIEKISVEVVQAIPEEYRGKVKTRPKITASAVTGNAEAAIDNDPATQIAFPAQGGWIKFVFRDDVRFSALVFYARTDGGMYDSIDEGRITINGKQFTFRGFGGGGGKGNALIVRVEGVVVKEVLIESIKGQSRPGISDTVFLGK